ncbi:MAG: hypothetical protein ACI8RE_002637 [Ilumatobacter sp.]
MLRPGASIIKRVSKRDGTEQLQMIRDSARTAASLLNTPKNSAPRPMSSAPSSNVMIDIEVSIVQYGTGQASSLSPRPVRALSDSA